MNSQVGAIPPNRPGCDVAPSGGAVHRPYLSMVVILCVLFGLTSCATIGNRFTDPTADWQARNGQLLYHSQKTSLIGEVLVRFSKAGDFELTFTKGPGVTLLTVRQNATFVRVSGPLSRGSWSGAPANAPARLRGWVELRDVLMKSAGQSSAEHTAGGEKFKFRF